MPNFKPQRFENEKLQPRLLSNNAYLKPDNVHIEHLDRKQASAFGSNLKRGHILFDHGRDLL